MAFKKNLAYHLSAGIKNSAFGSEDQSKITPNMESLASLLIKHTQTALAQYMVTATAEDPIENNYLNGYRIFIIQPWIPSMLDERRAGA
jgi:hypothetical protein